MTRHHYIIEFEVAGLPSVNRFRASCSKLVTENTVAGDIQETIEFAAVRYIKETKGINVSSNSLLFHLIALVHTTNK